MCEEIELNMKTSAVTKEEVLYKRNQ